MHTESIDRTDCPNCGCGGEIADTPDAYDGEKAMYYCTEETCSVELYRVKIGVQTIEA